MSTPAIDQTATLEQINAAIEQAKNAPAPAPAAPPPEAPKEIEVKIPVGGQVFRGKTQDEVIEQLVQAQTNATVAIQERNRQIEEARQRLAEAEQPKAPPVAPQGFNREEYYTLHERDPLLAHLYALQHAIGAPSPESAVDAIKHSIQTANETRVLMELHAFRTAVGDSYPESPDTTNMLLEKLQDAPITRRALMGAYGELVAEGRLKPVGKAAEAAPPAHVEPERPPVQVPAGGGGESAANLTDKAYDMSLDELKAFIQRGGK